MINFLWIAAGCKYTEIVFPGANEFEYLYAFESLFHQYSSSRPPCVCRKHQKAQDFSTLSLWYLQVLLRIPVLILEGTQLTMSLDSRALGAGYLEACRANLMLSGLLSGHCHLEMLHCGFVNLCLLIYLPSLLLPLSSLTTMHYGRSHLLGSLFDSHSFPLFLQKKPGITCHWDDFCAMQHKAETHWSLCSSVSFNLF